MKYKVLSVLLAAALLLCGCSLPQTPPPENGSAAPPQPGQAQQEQQTEQQTPPQPDSAVTPAALPVSGGVDWNAAPEGAMGTGGTMPEEAKAVTWQAWGFYDYDYREPYVADDLSRTVSVNRLTGLANTVLQQRINETVEQTVAEFVADDAPVEAMRRKAKELGVGVTCQMNDNIYTNAYIAGQILSVSVGRELYVSYTDENGEYILSEGYSEMEAWHYSLRDNSELLLSDLFSNDCDYAALLRQQVTRQLSDYELKRPFRGLPADYSKFILSGGAMQLWIPGDNPYIETVFGYPTYVYLSLDQLYQYMPLLQGDPTEYLLPGAEIRRQLLQNSSLQLEAGTLTLPPAEQQETSFTTLRLRQTEGVAAEQINRALEQLEADIVSGAALGLDGLPPYDTIWVDCEYIAYQHHICLFYYVSLSHGEEYSGWRVQRTFDLRSGEMLRLQDIAVDQAVLLQELQERGLTEEQARQAVSSPDFCIYSDLSVSLGSQLQLENGFLSDTNINADLF